MMPPGSAGSSEDFPNELPNEGEGAHGCALTIDNRAEKKQIRPISPATAGRKGIPEIMNSPLLPFLLRTFRNCMALCATVFFSLGLLPGTDAAVAPFVEPYDWSHASPVSQRYRVTVNGRPVFVGDFWREHFAQFAFAGRAEVEVTFLGGDIDLKNTAVSPQRLEVPFTVSGNRMRFTIEHAKQYVIRINTPQTPAVQLDYLFLFAEALETPPTPTGAAPVVDVVASGIDATGKTDVTGALSRLIETAPAGAVLHFPRGTYHIEDLVIRRSGAQLHLAPGAFLQARLPGTRANRRRAVMIAEAGNVTIRGRGLIEASGYALSIEKAPGVVVEDVMIRSVALGKAGVTPGGNEDGGRGLVLGHSDGYRLTNLKILTIMDQEIGKGKDAMNLASSSDALVEKCFTVSGDDTYTIKGRHDSAEWITVDLGRHATLARVVTKWGAGYFPRYVIEVADDERSWTEVATVENKDGSAQSSAVKRAGRFVRLRSLGRPVNYQRGDLLREFEVYGEGDPKANLALRRPVRISPHGAPWPGGHEAAKAVDGDPATSWANDYRSRRVRFRDNVALVTANPIKIGTGSEYGGEDILWKDHDVIDSRAFMNFSHYNYQYPPHEMAMTNLRVRNARFEDAFGLVEVGWYFKRTDVTYPFATKLDAEFENVTFDHIYPGESLFRIIANPETGQIRLKFINLKVAGRMIASFEDLRAVGVQLDLRGMTDDDRVEFVVRP